jgi:hypothetical protein
MFSIKRCTTHPSSPIAWIGLASVLSWQCHAATIQGTAFEDVNDNGVMEACEEPLSNTTISIQDDATFEVVNATAIEIDLKDNLSGTLPNLSALTSLEKLELHSLKPEESAGKKI